MKHFGELLEALRADRALTKKELATRTKLSDGYISLLAHGKKRPSVDTVASLTQALATDSETTQRLFAAAGYSPQQAEHSLQRQPKIHAQHAGPLSPFRHAPEEAGIVAVHDVLPIETIMSFIATSNQIRILNTYMLFLPAFQRAFQRAASNGATVQILLLDHRSDLARQRSRDLQMALPTTDLGGPQSSPGDALATENIWSNVLDFRALRREGLNVEVRLYNALPSVQLYFCDDHAFVSFFTHGTRSVQAPQLEILGKDTVFGKTLMQDFENLWEQSAQCVVVPNEGTC